MTDINLSESVVSETINLEQAIKLLVLTQQALKQTNTKLDLLLSQSKNTTAQLIRIERKLKDMES